MTCFRFLNEGKYTPINTSSLGKCHLQSRHEAHPSCGPTAVTVTPRVSKGKRKSQDVHVAKLLQCASPNTQSTYSFFPLKWKFKRGSSNTENTRRPINTSFVFLHSDIKLTDAQRYQPSATAPWNTKFCLLCTHTTTTTLLPDLPPFQKNRTSQWQLLRGKKKNTIAGR